MQGTRLNSRTSGRRKSSLCTVARRLLLLAVTPLLLGCPDGGGDDGGVVGPPRTIYADPAGEWSLTEIYTSFNTWKNVEKYGPGDLGTIWLFSTEELLAIGSKSMIKEDLLLRYPRYSRIDMYDNSVRGLSARSNSNSVLSSLYRYGLIDDAISTPYTPIWLTIDMVLGDPDTMFISFFRSQKETLYGPEEELYGSWRGVLRRLE